jgi:hypothetical protein
MQIPAAMFIESAADSLAKLSENIKVDQEKELSSFGDVRAQAIGASGLSKDFTTGYALGLQTARTLLFLNMTLRKARIKPEDLL